MKRMALVLSVIVYALVLMGANSCEPPGLEDSIDPIGTYEDQFLHNGDQGVNPTRPLVVDLGKLVDPATLNTGTVKLTMEGGGSVSGLIVNFDTRVCDADTINGCPRAFYFNPGAGTSCDLDPKTTYVMTISGVVLANGDTMPDRTIKFTTGGFPPGYTPNLCSAIVYDSFIISGNTLNQTTGLTGGSTLDPSSQLEIAAIGVDLNAPYLGYKEFANPRYYAMVIIRNSDFLGADYVISDGDTLQIRYEGKDQIVYLPGSTIPALDFTNNYELVLYVADDGSSYYAYNNGGNMLHDKNVGDCLDTGDGCTNALTPAAAFTPTYLAKGASGSPSVTPFKLARDSIDSGDSTSALHGGVVDAATNSAYRDFYLMGIKDGSSTGGYDEFDNTNYWGLLEFLANPYGPSNVTYLDPSRIHLSDYLVGHINSNLLGDALYHATAHLNYVDALLLIYLENRSGSAYNLAGTPTIDVTDGGTTTTVSLPAATIPAGEALPLYVSTDGSSFYAYDGGGGVHTLDLILNGCDIGLCPTFDPATALGNGPAATAP